MVVDRVRIRLAQSRHSFVCCQYGRELVLQAACIFAPRSYGVKFIFVEHRHFGFASPAPQQSHEEKFTVPGASLAVAVEKSPYHQ